MAIPYSKSYAQRAILCSIFSKRKTRLHMSFENTSSDVKSALRLLVALRVPFEIQDEYIDVDSTKLDESILEHGFEFNCGESGTLIRMLATILCEYDGKFILDGDGSLLHRKMDSIEPYFKLRNVDFATDAGLAPIEVCGKDRKNISRLEIDGSETSQYISGTIMGACFTNQPRKIAIKNCPSFEYVKTTVKVLQDFGYDVSIDKSVVTIGRSKPQSSDLNIQIELDWSSLAAYLCMQCALRKDYIAIGNADLSSTQCDKRIIDLLHNWYSLAETSHGLELRKVSDLDPFEFDCTTSPDLFPVLCALAATLDSGYSRIRGLSRLVNKESDRGMVMTQELKKYGAFVYIEDDDIYIRGNAIQDAVYDSHNDHRIAMALLIIRKYYGLDIPECDKCLDKSYPDFIKDTCNL